jgi:outer membrane protein OmpA-like peptidoglycan-associated protein
VTLDSTGVAAPATLTVTVRVTDGRGGSGASSCEVRLEPPPRSAESVTCTSGGFPRNLARLNNVDKACLDDAATRLGRDRGSRVTIVGHADTGERFPEVVSRKRAEAAKEYLVKERGIDASRITVRGAGVTQSLGTAAGPRNRRVELTFVRESSAQP